MSFLRLAAADVACLGCPEELPMDLASLTNREAIQLRTMGYATPRQFRRALQTKDIPVLDADGTPELDADGEPVVDTAMDYAAWTVLVWLLLRRAGVNVDVREFEFDLQGMEYVPDPEPAEIVEADESGKAEDPEALTS